MIDHVNSSTNNINKNHQRRRRRRKRNRGRGLVNTIINKLPFELHLPGYQYCGPGTKLSKRIERDDPGINPLDAACKEHDIVYSKNRESGKVRNAADKVLADKAWQRVLSKDSSLSEKTAAYTIVNAMKLKSKLGMGMKKKKKNSVPTSLANVVKAASKALVPNSKYSSINIRSALKKARETVKKSGGKANVRVPRVLPVPKKIGGFLPFLVPLFAGLSATGALAGGAAGIAKAVNDANAAKRELEERKRHNKTMEDIALGKGLYLRPYKKGYGLYLKPYKGQGICKALSSKVQNKRRKKRKTNKKKTLI